jgi:glycine cleavage system aminomethyltransferase T
MHMMDSCRIEKAFRHFGHDITCEDHVLEAGLGFAVKTEARFHRPRCGAAHPRGRA